MTFRFPKAKVYDEAKTSLIKDKFAKYGKLLMAFDICADETGDFRILVLVKKNKLICLKEKNNLVFDVPPVFFKFILTFPNLLMLNSGKGVKVIKDYIYVSEDAEQVVYSKVAVELL